MSIKPKELLAVLNRKFIEGTTKYKWPEVRSGWVVSPIAGKNISNKQWLGILTNAKLKSKDRHPRGVDDRRLIESSIETFASDFHGAVLEEPERMIKLVLLNKNDVLADYVDALFAGVAYSKKLNNVPMELLETLILSYSNDHISIRASHICEIIGNRSHRKWSQAIIDLLKDFAISHAYSNGDNLTSTKSREEEVPSYKMLEVDALNSAAGRAARAIEKLLWQDESLLNQFECIIEKLAVDKRPVIKLVSLSPLCPAYNIDKEWASEMFLSIYEQDYRLAGYRKTKDILFLLYPKYRERVLPIIEQCYKSADEELVQMGGHCLAEMYILNGEFAHIIDNVDTMNQMQAEAILQMTINYFNLDKYNVLVKEIICKFKMDTYDLGMPLSRLFFDNLINLERDKEFLIEIMNSVLGRRLVYAFTRYLAEESRSVIDYKDIILSMSHRIVDNNDVELNAWDVQGEVLKLVIGLYDETAASVSPEVRTIARSCLDVLDLMFEKQIGSARQLSHELMSR